MKKLKIPPFVAMAVVLILFSAAHSLAQDNCKSPYFIVLSDEEDEALLPLKSTEVDVNISGVIADVNVKQTYTNSGKSTIEAIYVFPASTRAAVYDMAMKVDDRIIKAVIQEKAKARKTYKKAKKEGKTASLLEEERPNVFKMSVANITPGATVEVSMSYTELLVPTDKIYEFVYPTVVGPRYVSKAELKQPTTKNWTGNPYLKKGKAPTSTLNIDVDIAAGMPIKQVICETHNNNLSFKGHNQAQLQLQEPQGGNRDFIMQYQLAGNKIESGSLVYKDTNGESYFLAMMQPPKRIEPKTITPREYIFIVDVSGSMYGFPLNISKKLMQNLLHNLNKNDLFNIVFFAGGSKLYATHSLPVNNKNIESAIKFMDAQRGGGGTELLTALKTAMSLNSDDNYARSFVILTDGYISVEKKAYAYVESNLNKANFFAFGIGSSVNRYLIEGLAHVGRGEPFIATTPAEATEKATKFAQYISQPVLTNISYQISGAEAYDVIPAKIPDLFADRPIIISGKLKNGEKAILSVRGYSGNGTYAIQTEMAPDESLNTKALKYLWAREKVLLLADYYDLSKDSWNRAKRDSSLRKEITQLGIDYNLLTEFTSFVAVDSVIVNAEGKNKTIKQPLPLPKGVSENAIGAGEMIPVTRQQGNPPPPPPKLSNVLYLVEDNVEMEEGLEIVDIASDEEEVADAEVFMTVETMPQFPGGTKALMKYLSENMKYPPKAQQQGIQGRVFVNFVVDTDGKIINVTIMRGVHPLLDKEAIRIVKTMPKWIPGTQRGKKVKVSYTLPINFVIKNQ